MKTSRTNKRWLSALALACGVAGAATAQTTDAQRIADLERRLESLMLRLQQVEARPADAAAPRSAADAAATAPPSVAPPVPSAALSAVALMRPGETGLPIRAFIDIGYARDKPDAHGRHGGFGLGNLNLYMTPSFGENIKSIVELVFEQDPDGALLIDLERVQLGYTFSDALTLWGGRFHTPFGYWNAAFHHGAQIQTSVLRPRFLGFEDQGGVLPVHGVGLLGSGSVALAGGRLKYDLYVANGTPVVDGVLEASGFKDDNRDKMVGGNLRHEFGGGLAGLTLGVHALTAQVRSEDAAGLETARTRLSMGGVFAVYEREPWELIGEYYAFRNRDLLGGSGRHASWAGYVQAGYAFGPGLTVYGRAEQAEFDQADAYFASMNAGRSYRRASVGLRHDFNVTTALKFEFLRTNETQGAVEARSNGVRGQVAVRF